MMNVPENSGEASCKRQENGDGFTTTERPLKKARFAWQVKGKYHLKNETSDLQNVSASSSKEVHGTGSCSENESEPNDLVGNTEQNLEILGDYLLKQDFNTLDSVITDTDKTLLKPISGTVGDNLGYPIYVPSHENSCSNISASTSSSNEGVPAPMSTTISPSYNEDQCIARWQARQMAKCLVDNTINRVLDSWMVAPLPAQMDSNRFLALDVAEFINNLPGDNTIENEGILMAISAHGLQNTSGSSSKGDSSSDAQIGSSSSVKDDIFPSPPSSPLPSDDEIPEERGVNNIKTEHNISNIFSNYEQQNSSDDFSIFPQVNNSAPSYQYFGENLQTANAYFDEDISVRNNDSNSTTHFDFMDAAVTFAIQNKGLTSFGTDYG